MAKRGRKPTGNKKNYFGEREENAVVAYNETDSSQVKDEIYNTILKPAFIIMIESIIRRYHLYGPDEEFGETFNDTLSFMLTKMGNFKPEIIKYEIIEEPSEKEQENAEIVSGDFIKNPDKDSPNIIFYTASDDALSGDGYYKKVIKHCKAYSYCGTVAKNYLIQKISQYDKKLKRNTPYEEVNETIDNNIRYSEDEDSFNGVANELIQRMAIEVKKIVDQKDQLSLTTNEVKVGMALANLLENWENIFDEDNNENSNKLNKSFVLYFLREETRLDTPEIRKGMKRYKNAYGITKEALLN